MMKYSVFSRQDPFSNQLCDRIRQTLDTRSGFSYSSEDPELVICVGGDGTLLRAIHYYMDQIDDISFVGVHTGTLGFFTDYTVDQFPAFIEDLCHGEVYTDCCNLLEIDLEYPEHKNKTVYALNEIRLGSFEHTVAYDIYIDDEFFEHTTGSGVCISTQAGSTAVNRALKGAVIDSGLQVLQFVEIMPISHNSHHSLQSPYIMRSDRCITVSGSSLEISSAAYDYLDLDVRGVQRIHIHTSRKHVKFARFRPYSYLERIRNLY